MKKDLSKVYLYGKHALREALLAKPECVQKVYLDANAEGDKELTHLLATHKIGFTTMKQEKTKVVEEDAVHQGVIAVINTDKLYTSLESVLPLLDKGAETCFVLLDELHDPHNVGAIIRSAVAFGASAILMPEHNQSPITGTVIKTSAGMVFRIPIVKIGNVNQTLRMLKEKHMWSYGLVMNGDTKLKDAVFDTPTLFIVGNESVGIREKTMELCDVGLTIPMDPNCESLNASVAASVVLYEWSRKK
ncbi:MAG TPA: 23S rRNA (guanosine(2251)-2'-O)-methyltransferase RlmB [Candidatus Paceibacterota bacterium]|jgi:23S rRNA (guanosine2251-2'-O)-methyltransferase|nr:23S rRNA (guanosine(2251)-2'-O)-methyltransferase RlmB [Candidatus Paceibacterota bacterium]